MTEPLEMAKYKFRSKNIENKKYKMQDFIQEKKKGDYIELSWPKRFIFKMLSMVQGKMGD